MNYMVDIEIFVLSLKGLGSKERAKKDQKYHKSARVHWGVPLPVNTKFTMGVIKGIDRGEWIPFAKALWETNLFDPMMSAGKILGKVMPSRSLWGAILECLKVVDGWALEDLLAHAAWKSILADETLLDEVEKWTQHENFWMRRAALVYTLPFAKKGRDPERMLSWAAGYAEESEWFIQKAIGWWLRVLSEHNPKRVFQFLEIHNHKLKGVARREATRKIL